MAEKNERLDQMLCIPLTKAMKAEITRVAKAEERKPADMGRVLWREALEAREEEKTTAPSK